MFKMVCTGNAKNLFDLKLAQKLSLKIRNVVICLGGEKSKKRNILKTEKNLAKKLYRVFVLRIICKEGYFLT